MLRVTLSDILAKSQSNATYSAVVVSPNGKRHTLTDIHEKYGKVYFKSNGKESIGGYRQSLSVNLVEETFGIVTYTY